MKISVLTVCYNSAETIAHTLDSFCAQTHEDKELVIIDGASTDDTLAVVDRYRQPGITVLSEPDRGMYDALNKGLGLFTGDAFGVLNADDTYSGPNALATIATGLADADMVHGNLRFVEDHEAKRVVRRWTASDPGERHFRSGWMPAHPTFYVRRHVAEDVGLFDLQYKTASDYDWMMRAVRAGHHTLGRIDETLVDMQQGGKSTVSLRSHIDHNLEALRARRKWLGAGLVDYALFAKPLGKIGQYFQR
ncbi:MAG: glycosyltransferase family 2 protein [Pseudomonadota bacterium]